MASAALFAWAFALGAVVSSLVLTATASGLGMTPDSVQYLGAATGLLEGRGLSALSSHWPPGYPAALAAAAITGRDVLAAAPWLHAGIVAASLVLLALSARQSGWGFAIVAAFLVVGTHPGFLHMHFLLWSEPLFLLLLLANSWLLANVIHTRSHRAMWVGLILATSAATLVRYAGLFLIVANAIALLMFARRFEVMQRVKITCWVSGASLLPLLAWMALNHGRGVAPVNRSLSWHPPDLGHLHSLQATVSNWFGLPDAMGLFAFSVLLAIAAWTILRARFRAEEHQVAGVAAVLVISYVAFLLLSITFVDHHTPVDERLLSPIFPAIWLLLFHVTLSLPTRFTRVLATVVLSFLLARGSWHGMVDWKRVRDEGLGLTSKQLREMPIMDWMRSLPTEIPIATNGPELCTIHLQRDCRMLPTAYNPTSRRPNPQAAAELEAMSQGPTLVIHFYAMAYRSYLPDTSGLEQLSDMRLVYRGPDGIGWIRHAEEPIR